MKIGFDASQIATPQKAGIGNYSFCLSQALSNLDSDNSYIFFFREQPSNKVRQTLFSGKQNFSFKVLNNSFLWTNGALARQTFLNNLDILFMPYPVLPIIRNPSLKTVVTFHDLSFEFLPEYQKFPKKYFLRLIPRLVANQATQIVAVSEFTKKSLLAEYGISPEKIEVIYEGVNFDWYQKTYSSEEKKAVFSSYNLRRPYILFVGTIQPRKNLERLVAAFSQLKHRFGAASAKLSLVLAGKQGWLADDIYAAPQEYNVADSVKFLGRVPDKDLPLLYQQAECLAFPSLFEGFGLPVLEAMAAGTPVVTSNVSSLPEVGGDAAFYVEPRDIESIATGLGEVLLNTDLRKSLVERGLRRVHEFSWENTARRLIEVFRGVNTNPPGGGRITGNV